MSWKKDQYKKSMNRVLVQTKIKLKASLIRLDGQAKQQKISQLDVLSLNLSMVLSF